MADIEGEVTVSAFGASLVDDDDAATARGTLGLGSAATTDNASESEMESETAKVVLGSTARYHPGVAKAWANFAGTGTPAFNKSHGCSSITDNGTGNYTVNLSRTLVDGNSCVVTNGQTTNSTVATGHGLVTNATIGTTSVQLLASDNNTPSLTDLTTIHFALFGEE